MEYPSSGMTYYNEQQCSQPTNNSCNPIQLQFVDYAEQQHLAYAAYVSPNNSSDLDSSLFQANYMSQQTSQIVNPQQHMAITYGDGLPLSDSSVCSSTDICSPDIHPIADTMGMPSDMVAQVLNPSSSPTISHQSNSNMMTSQPNHVCPWPSSAVTHSDLVINHQTASLRLSSDAMTHTTEDFYESMGSDQSVDAPTFAVNRPLLEQNDANPVRENPSGRSIRRSFNHRRNTVSLPYQVRDLSEKDLRRQSMNDLQKKQDNPFCHLSREQLIQRVVELEQEKRLSSGLLEEDSPVLRSAKLEVSDKDLHVCRWAGCDTSATSLDQLIAHIKDLHIGSGKAAYYCQWESCPREQKPFLKRHKMQNHMRTHTGERPFECTVEGCDKRFSRPDSLNTHIKTHSSIRPYACPVENCTKAYFHSRSLRKHAKSHEISNTPKSLANDLASTNTKPVDIHKGQDVTIHRLPYDRPPRYYHHHQQQQQSCGSEALHQTPHAPMISNTDQQLNSIGMMHPQQIFAAGTAYTIQQREQLHYQQHQLLYQEEKSQQAYDSSQQCYYQQPMQYRNPGYNYIY